MKKGQKRLAPTPDVLLVRFCENKKREYTKILKDLNKDNRYLVDTDVAGAIVYYTKLRAIYQKQAYYLRKEIANLRAGGNNKTTTVSRMERMSSRSFVSGVERNVQVLPKVKGSKLSKDKANWIETEG